jgi:hypothetical protein
MASMLIGKVSKCSQQFEYQVSDAKDAVVERDSLWFWQQHHKTGEGHDRGTNGHQSPAERGSKELRNDDQRGGKNQNTDGQRRNCSAKQVMSSSFGTATIIDPKAGRPAQNDDEDREAPFCCQAQQLISQSTLTLISCLSFMR